MSKTINTFIAVLFAAGLAACGGQSEGGKQPSGEPGEFHRTVCPVYGNCPL